ncbi:HAMP domain-containing histidine kinase [Patescibacteria group bacterium]|nr:HAMP domain-containing histidine kinase [Patescibacteria group bacterium]MBU4481165.1 HAMP domain-containing histidine kinase [Patescibacteria group bacterium]
MFLTGQHHTRTPLSNIKNFACFLLDGGFGHINKGQKQALKIIINKVEESVDLANLYLDVSEFEAGKGFLDKKEVYLEKIIRDQMKKLAYEAKLKGVKITFKSDKDLSKILVDPEKIGLVYYTLLDNAIKYTPQKEGKIILGLKKTEKETILFSCQDNGIGIKKEEISSIAKAAFQRSKEARSVHGTGKGLALYLSRLIVEAHQGELWAESEGLSKGSTFYVELPMK